MCRDPHGPKTATPAYVAPLVQLSALKRHVSAAAPQCQAPLREESVSSHSAGEDRPIKPARLGPMEGRTKERNGAPLRLMTREDMSMERVTMASVEQTVLCQRQGSVSMKGPIW